MIVAGVKIPPEIWLDVADYLNTTDLKSLLFVNKKLRDVGMPLLFRTLTLDISKYSSDLFCLTRDLDDNVKTKGFRYFKTLTLKGDDTQSFNRDLKLFLRDVWDRLISMMGNLKEVILDANVEYVGPRKLSSLFTAISGLGGDGGVEVKVYMQGFNMIGSHQEMLDNLSGLVELCIYGGLTTEGEEPEGVQQGLAAAIANCPNLRKLELEDTFAELNFDRVLCHLPASHASSIQELTLAGISPMREPANVRKLDGLRRLRLDTRGCSYDPGRADAFDEHMALWDAMRYHGSRIKHLSVDMVTSSLLAYLSSERISTLEINIPSCPADFVSDVDTMRELAKQFWGVTLPALLRNGLRGLTVMFYTHDDASKHECPWDPLGESARRWSLEYMAKHAHKYRPVKLRYINVFCPAVKQWSPTALRSLAVIASRNKCPLVVALTLLLNRPDDFLDERDRVGLEVTSWIENPENCAGRKFKFGLNWQCLCYVSEYAELMRFRDLDMEDVGVEHRTVMWKPKPPVEVVVIDDDDDGGDAELEGIL